MRDVHTAERQAERDEIRAQYSAEPDQQSENVRLYHADCREFDWPDAPYSGCVADPPWSDLEKYSWLAGWAAEKVRPGGWVMVQCSTAHVMKVGSIFAGAGLEYVWALSFAFNELKQYTKTSGFRSTWRPVLLFCRPPRAKIKEVFTDFISVRATAQTLHHWQQPLLPFQFWLGMLFRPGEVVADPFTGSGTTGEAAVRNGVRFIGTEIDAETYKVARGRLAKVLREMSSLDKAAR